MPKAERIRNKAHLAATKPKPSGDLQTGSSSSIPQLPILQGIEEKPQPPLTTAQPTKKEKMLERRESFLRKLGTTRLPPSLKNHARRMKRKAKEQLAGETLADLSHALASLEADSAANAEKPGNSKVETKKPQQTVGLIGEGKSRSLSKSQRKRMFELERFRHPLILQNPEFSANPFETIQIHAKNTLLKHTPSNP